MVTHEEGTIWTLIESLCQVLASLTQAPRPSGNTATGSWDITLDTFISTVFSEDLLNDMEIFLH